MKITSLDQSQVEEIIRDEAHETLAMPLGMPQNRPPLSFNASTTSPARIRPKVNVSGLLEAYKYRTRYSPVRDSEFAAQLPSLGAH